MAEEVIPHLIHNVRYTWFFAVLFVAWPVVVGFGGLMLAPSSENAKISLGETMYRSWATYSGFNTHALNPAVAEQRWFLLVHRLVGALAWAYAAAIFIASIG
jgi:hypothetical protein